jgi:shikimate kinase
MTRNSRKRLTLICMMDDSTRPGQRGKLGRNEPRAVAQRARSPASGPSMAAALAEQKNDDRQALLAEIREGLGKRSIVLIGLMGAGKTALGRRLAHRLDLPFVDADNEIEEAAGATISEIFAEHGEPYFRQGERKVIARLLENAPQVLSTGGGAYMSAETRTNIKARGVSVWLKADLRVLMKRVGRRDQRPLLAGDDPEAVMRRLIEARYPVYAEADITVESRDVPHEVIVDAVIDALGKTLGCKAKPPAKPAKAAKPSGHGRKKVR